VENSTSILFYATAAKGETEWPWWDLSEPVKFLSASLKCGAGAPFPVMTAIRSQAAAKTPSGKRTPAARPQKGI